MSHPMSTNLKSFVSLLDGKTYELPSYSAINSKNGAKGGRAKVPKGFAMNRKLAIEAGRKGGSTSRKVKL